jgi:hypothetical protein
MSDEKGVAVNHHEHLSRRTFIIDDVVVAAFVFPV